MRIEDPIEPRLRWSGTIYVTAAAALWGISAVIAQSVFREGVPPLVVVELRLLLSVIALLPILLIWNRASLRVPKKAWPGILVLGVLGLAPIQGLYYVSLSFIGVGLAILLQYLAPALVVLYEAARGRAPLSSAKIAGLGLTLLGLALLVLTEGAALFRQQPLGMSLGLLNALFYAFYLIYSKRVVATVSRSTVHFYGTAIAALVIAFFVSPFEIVSSEYRDDQWIRFVVIAVLSVLIPFALFYRGIARIESWRAAITAMIEPIIAAVTAWIFLGETLSFKQWIGAVILLSAIAWLQHQEPEN